MDFETCTFGVFLEEHHDKLQDFYDGKKSAYEIITSLDTEGADSEFIIIEMYKDNYALCERARIHGLPPWKRLSPEAFQSLWAQRNIILAEYPDLAEVMTVIQTAMEILETCEDCMPYDVNYHMAELISATPLKDTYSGAFTELVGEIFLAAKEETPSETPYEDAKMLAQYYARQAAKIEV